jgi:hypothetical protein
LKVFLFGRTERVLSVEEPLLNRLCKNAVSTQ